MSLLDVKLRREVTALASQIVAVALVMACGLAMMIMTRSLIRSLDDTRAAYYREYRFAQVFASLKRAPLSLVPELRDIPGVVAVQPTVAEYVNLDLPGVIEPARGLINTVPDVGSPELNQLHVREGRLLDGSRRYEVVVSEAFAEARNLHPGDTVYAVLNGRRVPLHLVGVVLSPEFVFEAPPGAALPDNKTFGVFWMRYRELSEAYSLYGGFNHVALALAPGAQESDVIAQVDHLLQPYGGLGAYGRVHHPSNTRLSDEIRVLAALSVGFPIVFLSVAAFMTHAVVSRQIALQREQIAILKAFGFGPGPIGAHFVKFALSIVVLGVALGLVGGVALGHRLVIMYHLFFRFPTLEFHLAWGALVAAVIVSSGAALVGVWGAVRKVTRLAPAQAMRPEPPSSFGPAIVERIGLGRWLPVSLRMALRNLERHGARSVLTCLALAMATGILVIPNTFRDGIMHILDYQWDKIYRQGASLVLVEPDSIRAFDAVRHLPGVREAEPFRSAPVELIAGHRTRRIAVTGLLSHGVLGRVMDQQGRQIDLPASGGIVLSAALAEGLGVKEGDAVTLRVLDGRRPIVTEHVAALAEDFASVACFMEFSRLNRVLGDGDRVNGAYVSVARSRWDDFLRSVKATPRVGGLIIKEAMRASFRDTTAKSIGLIQVIYLVFATVVATGIVYNTSRISLSERARELATLRVLGFSRSDVAGVLVGELVVLTALALPIGLAFGAGAASYIVKSVNTETVRLPLVLTPANFAFAVLVVVVATSVSAWWACRRLDRLDLVGVLKAHE